MDDPNEDDSDILGTSTTEVDSLLRNRDLVITHGLIPELTPKPGDGLAKSMADEYIKLSTPWIRIQDVFCFNPLTCDCELSKAGERAINIPIALGVCIGFVMACFRSLTAYDSFVRSHQLTVWRTPTIAKQMAADHVFLKASMMFASVGIRTFVLTAGCYSFPLVFSAIQGRTSFWEYAVGWGLSCSLFCLCRGPRQAVAAGLLAFVPGMLYGTLHLHASRMMGRTFEDMYRAQAEVMTKFKLQE